MAQDKKKLKKKLTHKYRMVVINEDTFEEKVTFKLSRLNVFVFCGLLSVLLIVFTVLLIAFSPLKEYIPGYAPVGLEKKATDLAIKIDSLEDYVEKFEGGTIGTTQIDPSDFKNLYNFGGFTDGDRAVFLASHFKAKKIFLIGFDFDGKMGKYSFSENKDIAMKIRKLKWCEELIKHLEKENNNIQFL